MQTIGERLEEARKKKGISIREAAEATKIRGDYLQKFESNHFDIGLTEIYTRGFLRTYGNYLKVPTERLLNDYAALGRGDTRPRQPSREVYGRMDISVSTAGEPSDRAAPPEEGAANAEPTSRAQPRYPQSRGKTNLPSGPDPAVIFKYAKLAGFAVIGLLVVWAIISFASGRSSPKPTTTTPPPSTANTPAAPASTTPVQGRASITALDVVRIQVWAVDPSMPDQHGAELIPPTTLVKGDTISFPKNGPVRIYATAQENYRVNEGGTQFIPGDAKNNIRGAREIQIP